MVMCTRLNFRRTLLSHILWLHLSMINPWSRMLVHMSFLDPCECVGLTQILLYTYIMQYFYFVVQCDIYIFFLAAMVQCDMMMILMSYLISRINCWELISRIASKCYNRDSKKTKHHHNNRGDRKRCIIFLFI